MEEKPSYIWLMWLVYLFLLVDKVLAVLSSQVAYQ